MMFSVSTKMKNTGICGVFQLPIVKNKKLQMANSQFVPITCRVMGEEFFWSERPHHS